MTTASARPPRVLTGQFVGIIIAAGLYLFALDLQLPVLAPYLKSRFGAGDVAIGIAIGAFAFGAILLRPFVGWIGDRRGRRLIFVTGTAGVGATLLLYIVAPSIAALTVVRFFSGVAEAGAYVGIATMAVDRAPVERRGAAMAYFSASIYFSLAFGPFVGEAIYEGFGATSVWVASAALLFSASGIGFLLQETLPASVREADPEPFVLVHRRTLAPAAVLFLSLFGLAGFFAFVALYVKSIGMSDAAPVLFVYGGVVLVIRIFGARLFDRLGGRRGTTFALLCGAAGLALVWAWETPAGLYAGTALFAVGGAFLYTSLVLIVLDGLREAERGAAMGTFTSAFDLAMGVGAAACGGVAALFGYGAVFGFGALMAIVGLVVFWTMVAPRRATPTP